MGIVDSYSKPLLKHWQSTFLLWNQRKEAVGTDGITNSEFAKILLHQNLDVIRGYTRHAQDQSKGSTSLTPMQGKKSLNFNQWAYLFTPGVFLMFVCFC